MYSIVFIVTTNANYQEKAQSTLRRRRARIEVPIGAEKRYRLHLGRGAIKLHPTLTFTMINQRRNMACFSCLSFVTKIKKKDRSVKSLRLRKKLSSSIMQEILMRAKIERATMVSAKCRDYKATRPEAEVAVEVAGGSDIRVKISTRIDKETGAKAGFAKKGEQSPEDSTKSAASTRLLLVIQTKTKVPKSKLLINKVLPFHRKLSKKKVPVVSIFDK